MLSFILEKYRTLFAGDLTVPNAKTSAMRGSEIFFYAEFDLQALLKLAERLRGRPCSCNEFQRPKAGAFNFVVFLEFDDGVEWIFRAPSARYAAPQGDPGRILASEAATLKYIRENSDVPVTEVFDYSDTYDNEVGIPYILMSKAPGHPLATYEWRTHRHKTPRTDGTGTARALTDDEKAKILRQLGGIARQLSSLRFPSIGSIFEGDEGYFIGECLHPGYVLGGRVALGDLRRGPFHREKDFYSPLATALSLHAEQLPMGHHVLRAPVPVPQEYDSFEKYCTATDRRNDFAALGGLVDSSENRVEYCLVSHLLQDMAIPAIVQPPTQSVPGFPLQHHDISLENVFVDDDLNVTCIIDWSFCSTVPPAMLLSIPGLPHVRDLISDPFLMAAFHSGYEVENKKRGGRRVEPEQWRAGEAVSRFMRVVNLDALQDHTHLRALLELIRAPMPSEYSEYYREEEEEEEEEEKEGSDKSLRAILGAWSETKDSLTLGDDLAFHEEHESAARVQEERYFEAAGPDRLALTRKVALAAEMNPSFVADKRLWRWIDAVMESRDGPGQSSSEDDAEWTVVGTN